MTRKRQDPVTVHLETYPYKRGDTQANQPLYAHMQQEHPEDYARVLLGSSPGDMEDQHYIAHGHLHPVSDQVASRMLDKAIARHPAGKKLPK